MTNNFNARTAPQLDAPAGDTLVPLLISIAKSTRQLVSLKLAEIGVLAGQDQLLDILDEHRPRNIVEIAAALSVRPSTVSKMLDIFEAKAWAAREADKLDNRKVTARLTVLGGKTRQGVHAIWSRLDEELLKGLGEETGDAFAATLAQVDELLSRRLARLR